MPSLKQVCSLLLLCTGGLFTSYAMGDNVHSHYNMPVGVTPISQSVHDLHMIIFYICVVIGVLVFGVMFYALLKHRKARGHQASQFHESTTVEILWTIIPFVILIAIAIPSTKVLKEIHDTTESELVIHVTGYQWRWQYEYPAEGIRFFSVLSTPSDQLHNLVPKGEHYLREVDNPLIVPINKKIRFLFTAHDVIHSWWVPDLGFKKDAVPGYLTENWAIIEQPGIYRGGCAELCGKDHGYMPIVVQALPEAEYNAWVAKQQADIAKEKELAAKQWTLDELVKLGQTKYMTYCSACHQPDGKGLPPAFPPLVGDTIVKGDIHKHLETVLWGIAGTAMQGFGAQLSESDIAAIITYERNSWGNNMGDSIQPIDVKRAKDAGKK